MAVLQVRRRLAAHTAYASHAGRFPQFMSSGLPRTAVPSTIHCDHLIEARSARACKKERVGALLRPPPTPHEASF